MSDIENELDNDNADNTYNTAVGKTNTIKKTEIIGEMTPEKMTPDHPVRKPYQPNKGKKPQEPVLNYGIKEKEPNTVESSKGKKYKSSSKNYNDKKNRAKIIQK